MELSDIQLFMQAAYTRVMDGHEEFIEVLCSMTELAGKVRVPLAVQVYIQIISNSPIEEKRPTKSFQEMMTFQKWSLSWVFYWNVSSQRFKL